MEALGEGSLGDAGGIGRVDGPRGAAVSTALGYHHDTAMQADPAMAGDVSITKRLDSARSDGILQLRPRILTACAMGRLMGQYSQQAYSLEGRSMW
jgi:hypothetical protein